MTERTVWMLAYFFFLICLNCVAARWLLERFYKAAGLKEEDEAARQLYQSVNQRNRIYLLQRIADQSPDAQAVWRALFQLLLAVLPSLLGLSAAMSYLWYAKLGVILRWLAVLLPIYSIGLALAGVSYKKKHPPTPEEQLALEQAAMKKARLREQAKKRFPPALRLSATLYQMLGHLPIAIVGAAFVAVGLFVRPLRIMAVVGGLLLLFYLYRCITSTRQSMAELLEELSEAEVEALTNAVQQSGKGTIFSLYQRVAFAAEEQARTGQIDWDFPTAGEEILPEPEPGAVDDDAPVLPMDSLPYPGKYRKADKPAPLALAIRLIFGTVFMIGGIWLAVQSVQLYQQSNQMMHWPIVSGMVTEVTDYRNESGDRLYDVKYVYFVEAELDYTGEVVGTQWPFVEGEEITVVCNPAAPEESCPTQVQEAPMETGALLINLLLSGIFVLMGLFASGIPALLARRKRNRQTM